MKRFLIGQLFLAAFGMALAQPADYQLWCGDEIIGALSITEEQVHLAVLEGVTCGDVVATPGDAPFTVWFTLGEEGELVVTLYFGGEAYDGGLTPMDVPQQALAGMLRAQENRAMAMRLREAAQERAQERGAGARPDVLDDDELEVDADDGPPEWVDLPTPAREAPRP